jgi:limonene-1,2-epoxide hydrolase
MAAPVLLAPGRTGLGNLTGGLVRQTAGRVHQSVKGAAAYGDAVSGTSRAAANDALVRRFLAAWERRDTDLIMDTFADDGVYHSIPLEPIEGKAAVRAFVEAFADVPPGRLEIHHQVASERVVMNERTDSITLNGRPVVLPISGVFEIVDGHITAWREYFDLGPARAAFESA